MQSDNSAVIRVLSALSTKWPHQSLQLTGQELAMILQGLRGMSSEHVVVENILHKIRINLKPVVISTSMCHYLVLL